jgi:hypothetical protein
MPGDAAFRAARRKERQNPFKARIRVPFPHSRSHEADAAKIGLSTQKNRPETFAPETSATVVEVPGWNQLEMQQRNRLRFPALPGFARRNHTRQASKRVDARADAWLLADALASLSTAGLPEPTTQRGSFAVVSCRTRAVIEVFPSEEDARRALEAITVRRSTLIGRFAVVGPGLDTHLAGATDRPDEQPEVSRPHVA